MKPSKTSPNTKEIKPIPLTDTNKPKVLGAAEGTGILKPFSYYEEKWGNMRNMNDTPEERARKRSVLDQAIAKERKLK